MPKLMYTVDYAHLRNNVPTYSDKLHLLDMLNQISSFLTRLFKSQIEKFAQLRIFMDKRYDWTDHSSQLIIIQL